jgi:hypothetical protein
MLVMSTLCRGWIRLVLQVYSSEKNDSFIYHISLYAADILLVSIQ